MEWKPIETAPKDGSVILLRGKKAIADGWFGELTGAGWVWPYIYAEPLYWMPLPEAPNVHTPFMKLRKEVEAWRTRFPQHEYRNMDDCVSWKLKTKEDDDEN